MPVANAQGKRFNFPEGTTPEQMGIAIDEFFGGQAQQAQSQQAPTQQPQQITAQQPQVSQPQEPQQAEDKTTLAQDVDAALQSIPGVPSLTEFAAGVNRSVFGALDFLGPDNINAILNIAGNIADASK